MHMMNNSAIYLTLLVSAAFCLSACTGDSLSPAGQECNSSAEMKIVNTSDDAREGNLLVKVSVNGTAAMARLESRTQDTDGDRPLEEVLDEIGAVSVERVFPHKDGYTAGIDRWYSIAFDSDTDLEKAASLLAGLAEVEKVQYNTVLRKASDCRSYAFRGTMQPVEGKAATGLFNDPDLSAQWHYINIGNVQIAPTAKAGADINVKDAWSLTAGDPRIIVAVIDEGVQYDHPDLAANMWINEDEIPDNGKDDDGNGYIDDYHGWNAVTGNGTITWNKPGDTGHSTHIAGTIAAVNNNGTGVCGIAGGTGNGDGARIMTCPIFVGDEGGDSKSCASAIIYAAENGASIISCSFGIAGGAIRNDASYRNTFGIEAEALDQFMNTSNCDAVDGGIAIFAAGNDSFRMSSYPGAYSGCISVTAVAADGLPAYYTNYGPGCDIAAPGGEYYTGDQNKKESCILSTMPTESLALGDGSMSATDYGYMQGTSMACPHVSGVAALGLSYALKLGKRFTREEFTSMLLSSTENIDDFLTGTKKTLAGYSIGNLYLDPYRHNMGSGIIDAYRLLMQIEGTPFVCIKTGEESAVDLSPYFGGNAANLTYTSVSISDEGAESIGTDQETLYVKDGKLYILPEKTGAARIMVTAIVGGDSNVSVNLPSGMEITREFSVISRNVASSDGRWL